MNVYITDLATFLPNAPVSNQDMEQVLGMVNQIPSRTRSVILRNNRIRERYYAIDPATGRVTHTNARMTAEAVRSLHPYEDFSPDHIECLCCGTSSPDQLMPGHGLMVHGELGSSPCEVMTAGGICLSGITAFKYAFMNVALGLAGNAVATGSELASTFMRAQLCGGEQFSTADLEAQPILGFSADFLRWMLSDGAGAAFLTSALPQDRPAFRVEWIEHLSFAGELETCMYSGAVKNEVGILTGWRDYSSLQEAVAAGSFLVKQDVKLLNQEIIPTIVDRVLTRVIAKHRLDAEAITWFLPHYSSEFFRQRLFDGMKAIGFTIPYERWFTNLSAKGNTGSASIYIILEELFHSGRIARGDRVLCMIPESGRFSVAYMLLTAV